MSLYRIVFDHPDFLVIDKSPGVSVHKDGAEQGLLDVIKHDFKLNELYLAHRLDKPTSGLLLLAKTTPANSELSQLFQHRKIEKYYIALAADKPSKKQGIVRGDMAKARRGAWKLLRSQTNPAITRFFSYSVEGLGRLFILRPYTGKTHQLRVALKSIGAPVLGDPLYSSSTEVIEADRCYLHAFALRFAYQAKNYEFVSSPTDGQFFGQQQVQSVVSSLSAPWSLHWGKANPE